MSLSGARSVPFALVVVLVVLGALAGCDRSDPLPPPPATNPPNTGRTCEDPAGDLSSIASERGGTLTEPAGIDLLRAEARVTDESLQVSFTTVAPIMGAPNPELRLAQGQTGQLDSFELVATPPSPGPGPWELRLVTFRRDARGGIAEAPRQVLNVPVSVEGTTVSYEVPLRSLPAISSYVWQFGSSSTADPANDESTIIDDCEGTAPAGTTTTAPPTTAVAGAAVGDTQAYRTGSQVTVHAVEPASTETGTTNVAIDVRVCAPAAAGIETHLADLSVTDRDDRSHPAKAVAGAREPAFPETVVLDPGACRRAWATVPLPVGAAPAAVVYSPDPSGADALRWRMP